MTIWRFLDTGCSTAPINMAIDQAILETHANGNCLPTLRVYQWNPPAISLGYFQRRHGIDLEACQCLGIDVIRRPTGGRAVLHFKDLTYSIVAGTNDGIPSSVPAAYHLICEGLLAGFKDLGFEAEFRNIGTKSLRSDICFLIGTSGDILHKGKKFVGSAQTWSGSSMLQHGSITMEPNFELWLSLQGDRQVYSEETLKREMTSIREILGHVPAVSEISEAIQNGMTRTLGIKFSEGELSLEESLLAHNIAIHRVEESIVTSK